MSAVKAYDTLLTFVHLDKLPDDNATRFFFGMDNMSAANVLGAWPGIFNYQILSSKQIVEAIQQNNLEGVFNDSCRKLAAMKHFYAQKVIEHSSIIDFGRFELREETHEETIQAFKNYLFEYMDLADAIAYGKQKPGGKTLAEIKTGTAALIADLESAIGSMAEPEAKMAREAV